MGVDAALGLAGGAGGIGHDAQIVRPGPVRPGLSYLTQLGYLPIDKAGGDALFQVISQRYEHGSTVITTNRVFRKWAEIFNNDSTLTTALLDRLLHHCEVVRIEGESYRQKDQIKDY